MSKINHKDVTYILPFRCDSQDRLDNLELIIDYLTYHFDTNIIVKETSQQSVLGNHPLTGKVKYIWEFDCEEIFHRTKVLNDMLEIVDTEYVSNYDVDVLFPVQSYIDAVNALRNGEVFVFPYQGPFHEIPRKFIPEVKEKMEVNWIDLNQCGLNHGSSVGGSMFLNTKVYKELAGECTLFKSWGGEDNFRVTLFQKMGYKICRVGTVLYHFEHQRFLNSKPHHQHYNNNMNLFYQTMNMTKEQLKNFVDSYNRFK